MLNVVTGRKEKVGGLLWRSNHSFFWVVSPSCQKEVEKKGEKEKEKEEVELWEGRK